VKGAVEVSDGGLIYAARPKVQPQLSPRRRDGARDKRPARAAQIVVDITKQGV